MRRLRPLPVLALATALTTLTGVPGFPTPAQAASSFAEAAPAADSAARAVGEGPGCGGHQADWRSATLAAGFSGSVRATFWNGRSGPYGQRRIALVPGGVIPSLPNGGLAVISGSIEDTFAGQPDAFNGTAAVAGRGYTWTITPRSDYPRRPGGTASLLNPQCAAGSTKVTTATYHYQSSPATGSVFVRTLDGTVTRTG
ncbi:hypothetical protein [Streptosporangium sp. NPDC049376]|uniref:hypothetical protein n=1 Tax=Streptosporangium sp. NPDC049376 TaxID=3366192 RepID=UPI0037B3C9DE